MSIKSTQNSLPVSENFTELLRAEHIEVRSHLAMSEISPLKLGGVAQYVVIAESLTNLISVVTAALKSKLDYVVLGELTGALPSPSGFKGVIIINRAKGISYLGQTNQVLAESGVRGSAFVAAVAGKNLGGMEYLTVIPGTIGGAIATGAYYKDQNVWQSVRELVILVPSQSGGEITNFQKDQLQREVGGLMFANPINAPVILSAKLQLIASTPREILERVGRFRRLRNLTKLTKALGTIFKDWSPDNETLRTLNKNLPKSVWLNRNEPEILMFDDKTTLPEIVEAIEQIKKLLPTNEFRQRLTYLGYWQDDITSTSSS